MQTKHANFQRHPVARSGASLPRTVPSLRDPTARHYSLIAMVIGVLIDPDL